MKSNILRLLYIISVILGVLILIYYVILIMTTVINISLPDISFTLFLLITALWYSILIIIVSITKYTDRKKKKISP